ncbi:eukaryotic translation initiation factor-like protein, partial [Tanacetum coccineum]
MRRPWMHGMTENRMMPGAPVIENDDCVLILDEALQCVEELSAPEYHIELVKEVVSLALEKIPPLASIQLIEFLVSDYLISWSKTDGFTTELFEEWVTSILHTRKGLQLLENRTSYLAGDMELESKLDKVDRVVNKLKFDLLKDLLINSKITSVDTLQAQALLELDSFIQFGNERLKLGLSSTRSRALLSFRVTMSIHENAIAEPSLYSMYAQLCSDLVKKLPSFSSEDYFISFKRLLLTKCQETFEKFLTDTGLERSTKPHFIGNICFLGELFKQKLLAANIVHEVIE